MVTVPIEERELLTLGEAAKIFFPAGTADAASLKRLIRKGQLQAYRPGKQYLTTREDMRAMI